MEKGRELINQLNVIIERSVKAKKAGEDNDVIIFGNRVVTIVGIPLALCVSWRFFFSPLCVLHRSNRNSMR